MSKYSIMWYYYFLFYFLYIELIFLFCHHIFIFSIIFFNYLYCWHRFLYPGSICKNSSSLSNLLLKNAPIDNSFPKFSFLDLLICFSELFWFRFLNNYDIITLRWWYSYIAPSTKETSELRQIKQDNLAEKQNSEIINKSLYCRWI